MILENSIIFTKEYRAFEKNTTAIHNKLNFNSNPNPNMAFFNLNSFVKNC